MAREDKFVEKLQDFTDALGDLVDALTDQAKNNPSEVLNQLVDNFDGEKFNTIANDISEIKENVIANAKTTDKILEVVKEQKQANEGGIMTTIGEKSNKEKVIGAVQTVVLIAAGVLAIGMAFKIVGDVDFMSVVSLGMGIMFVAYAFSKVASIKDDDGKIIDFKKATQVSLIMIMMSAALLVSGLILNFMPVLSLGTFITIVGVGVSIGIATYLVMKALGSIKAKDEKKVFMAPIILPLIASSLVLSAMILTLTPEIDFWNVVKAGFGVGLAIIAVMPAFYIISKANLNISQLAMAGLGIVIMATAIMISSWILSVGNYDTYPELGWAAGVGLTMIAFTIPMIATGMMMMADGGISLMLGALGVMIIALAIVGVSYILQLGDYSTYPDIGWSIVVGVLMLSMGASMVFLAPMFPMLILGALGVLMVAGTIALVSHVLQMGDYSTYPDYKWSLGVGLSLVVFGAPMIALGAMILGSFGLGLVALAAGMGGVLLIADAIQKASHILGLGDYSVYPTTDWASGVGKSIMAFASALVIQEGLGIMNSFFGGSKVDLSEFIIKISKAILTAGFIFSTGGDYWQEGNYPGADWAAGVGGSITAFANALDVQQSSGGWFGDNVDFSSFIINVAKSIMTAGKMFSEGGDGLWKKGSYPGKDWAEGVGGSISAFAEALKAQADAGSWWSGKVDLSSFIIGVSKAILTAGNIFTYGFIDENGVKHSGGAGLYEKGSYPGKDWAEGVGGSITAFANAIKTISDSDIDIDDDLIDAFSTIAKGIVRVALIFKVNSDAYSGLFDPNLISTEWGENISSMFDNISSSNIDLDKILDFRIGAYHIYKAAKWLHWIQYYPIGDGVKDLSMAVTQLVNVLPNDDAVNPFLKMVDAIEKLTQLNWSDILNMKIMSFSIDNIAKSLDELNIEKIDGLLKLGAGFELLSLVDAEKLEEVLDTIDDKSQILKEVTDDKGYMRNMLDDLFSINDNSGNAGNVGKTSSKSNTSVVDSFSPFENKLIIHLEKIDENIDKMANPEPNTDEDEEELKGRNVEGH